MALISPIPTEIKRNREHSYYSEPFDGDTGENSIMFFRELSKVKYVHFQSSLLYVL